MGKFFFCPGILNFSRGLIVDTVSGPSSGLFAYLTRIMAFSSLAEKERFQFLRVDLLTS